MVNFNLVLEAVISMFLLSPWLLVAVTAIRQHGSDVV